MNTIHHRHSIRLKGYDYSQPGGYFITLVTHEKEYLFGNIMGGKMILNEFGEIVNEVWASLPNRVPLINLECAIVMPNHFHAIIVIRDDSTVGAIHELPLPELPPDGLNPRPMVYAGDQQPGARERRHMLLPLVIGYFKMNTAKQINILRDTPRVPVWQRNYYKHIIHSERELGKITEYICPTPPNGNLKAGCKPS